MSFAHRLRELREEKGLSREDLSQLCGLGRGTVRDYEQGRREPTLQSPFKLADALGVRVEHFKNGDEGKPAKAPGVAQEVQTEARTDRKPAGKGKSSQAKRKGKSG